jgi:hypothetical protein
MMPSRLAIAGLAAWLSGQTLTPTEADWDWLNANRETALEAVMPLHPPSRPMIAYRSYRDLYQDALERYFTIDLVGGSKPGQQAVTATIVVPVGKSIQQQILEAHMRDRRQPPSSVIAGIRVRQVTVSEAECSAMKGRLSGIPALRLVPELMDRIFLHPVVHRIVTDQYGVAVDVRVIDPDHPLVRWVLETHEALLACLPANTPLQPASGADGAG